MNTKLNIWIVGYYKNFHMYCYKEVIAKNADDAIKKARVKNIKELYIKGEC